MVAPPSLHVSLMLDRDRRSLASLMLAALTVDGGAFSAFSKKRSNSLAASAWRPMSYRQVAMLRSSL